MRATEAPAGAPPQRQLLFNAVAAVVYTTAQTAVGLGVYAYLIRALGAEVVGVWVSLMAVGMIACMSDLALNQALVRLVALSRHQPSGPSSAAVTMETLLLSTAMVVGLAFTLAYISFDVWSGWLRLEHQHALLAQSLLPWMCAGLWLNRLADAAGGALEGLQWYVARCTAGTVAFLMGLTLTVLLVPHWGLLGAAMSFTIQNAFVLLVNLVLLHKAQPDVRWWRPRFRRSILTEAIRYGTSLQGMVLAYALLESGCKLLLTRHGFLAAASYFDLAFRIGKGLRGLLASALRVLVPRIVTRLHIEGHPQAIYASSFLLVTSIAIPMYTAVLASADLMSWLIVGVIDPQFSLILILACAPWLAYCFIDPALNHAMAIGRMGWAFRGHVIKVVLAGLIVLALPHQATPGVVVAAVALSMVAGCAWMLLMAHRHERLSWEALAPLATITTLVASVAVIIWSTLDTHHWSHAQQQWHAVSRGVLLVALPACILLLHPGGQRILSVWRGLRSPVAHEAGA